MTPSASDENRLAAVERDSRDHARIITEFNRSFAEIDKREAVRAESEKHLDERLDRIEESIKSIYGLGKWLLGAVGGVLVTAIVGLVLKGGILG